MRWLITSTSLCLLAHVSMAQSYVPFPTDRAVWTDYVHVYGNGNPPSSHRTRHVLQGDTTVNGFIYKKVYVVEPGETRYMCGLREDEERNIWILPAGPDLLGIQSIIIPDPPEEVLLYAFGQLTVGEPVSVNTSNSNFVVTSIDSFLVDDAYRKSYRLSCQHLIGSEDIWIEGMGSLHGLFSPLQYEFEWTLSMECFTQDNLAWDNPLTGLEGCDIAMAADRIPRPTILMHPVPCSDHLNVQGFGAGYYTILNAAGQVLTQHELSGDGIIPLSMVAPGLHLLRFMSTDGHQRRTDRFVVQR